MQREIKFRAWANTHVKPWMDYEVTDIDLERKQVYTRHCFAFDYPGESILMQYTGLHDKNGKEIYEGDIVKHDGFYVGDGHYESGVDVVEFDDGCYLGGDGELNSYEIVNKGIEVIGNIYENPELLDITSIDRKVDR